MAPRPHWSRAEEDRVVALVARRAVSPRQLEQVHSHVVVSGEQQNNYVAAKLVRAFAELGLLLHARNLFDTVSKPNPFLWNAIIWGYGNTSSAPAEKSCVEATRLYVRMHRSGSPAEPPLPFTIASVLKACADFSALDQGKQMHAHAVKYGFRFDARVQTALVDLYGRCRRLEEACKVFHRITSVDDEMGGVQLHNTMIMSYCLSGAVDSARLLFDKMLRRNTYTWVEMVTGYAASWQMHHALRLFNELPRSSKDVDKVVVTTAMITGLSKCRDTVAARALFDGMPKRDVAMWNAMISGYTNSGLPDQAVELFRLMLEASGGSSGVRPNRATIAIVASACAQSGSAESARRIADYVSSCDAELLNSHTVAALVDMHAKCGDLYTAYSMFRRWKKPDLVCYSAMISGFGVHGRGKEAIRLFDELISTGLMPDSICFVSVLSACSHCGLVEEGRRYFESMERDYGLAPAAEHYMCMVDMLGRAGRIEESLRMIMEEVPAAAELRAGVWGALLGACRMHRNAEVAEVAAGRLMELEPGNAGNYVLLSNIYAERRRWEDAARVRAVMRRRGVQKPPGWSWLEVDGRLRKFLTGGTDDPRVESVMELFGWELGDGTDGRDGAV